MRFIRVVDEDFGIPTEIVFKHFPEGYEGDAPYNAAEPQPSPTTAVLTLTVEEWEALDSPDIIEATLEAPNA